MILQRIRRAAAALALAATLALAVPPAHAAGWEDLAVGAGWIESVFEWVARLWTGNGEPGESKPAIEKCGGGVDPNGCPGAPTPPSSSPTGSSGSGG